MPSNITAICPGTFDPVTVGHLDIITRGASKFGRVVVGLIDHPQRKSPLFGPDEREAFLKEALAFRFQFAPLLFEVYRHAPLTSTSPNSLRNTSTISSMTALTRAVCRKSAWVTSQTS